MYERYSSTVKINVFELDNNTDVISYPICEKEYGADCNLETSAYVVRHPYYFKNETVFQDNDFSLIFLPENITNVKPVALNADPNFPADGAGLEIFGWGDTNNNTTLELPNIPYTANVLSTPSAQCTLPLNDRFVISENQICIRNDGETTGIGDSGWFLLTGTE